MKDRRKSERRNVGREGKDRRRPVRVHSRPGERNTLDRSKSGEELLSELEGLELTEDEPEEPDTPEGFNPYDSVNR